MKALEIDPAQRYGSATAMANDLERTMIAARHSSRDLAKLLRGLFLNEHDDEPLVVVEAPALPESGPPTGTMPSVSSGAIRSSTLEISRSDRTRTSGNIAPGLQGAVLAEQSRLIQQKRKGTAKALFVLAILGAVGYCGWRVWPTHLAPLVTKLFERPPPPPPAPEPVAPVNIEPVAPEPPRAPAPKKRPPKRGKPGAASSDSSKAAPASDDVMKPSD
jgi:hypothetical protein